MDLFQATAVRRIEGMSAFSHMEGSVAEADAVSSRLWSPEETAECLGPELVAILADLYGRPAADIERTLTLLRPGSLATLEASQIVETKATDDGYTVTLTAYGVEMIAWCHEQSGDGEAMLSPDDFGRELREQAAAIED